jgi:two-component system chemotaxis sensor kinase CheA
VLINEILDLAKVESGNMEADIELVDLGPLANRLQSQFQPLADEKGLSFAIELASDLSSTIATEGRKVEQIVGNLLANAIKFTNFGSVILRIGHPDATTQFRRSDLTPQTTIAFSVTDTGIGIPEETQEAIFESFQQADGSTSRQYGGTGLGLTISREFANLLEGEIAVSSRLNEGSTFTLYIPQLSMTASDPQAPTGTVEFPFRSDDKAVSESLEHEPWTRLAPLGDSATAQEAPSSQGEESQSMPYSADHLHDKKVLLVDDDMRNMFALSSALEKAGLIVVLAENGQIALDVLEQQDDFDVILMDIMMPVMDGFEAMHRIRQNKRFAELPIIALTAKAQSKDRDKCITAGADDYLSKPVDVDRLLSLIGNWTHDKCTQDLV